MDIASYLLELIETRKNVGITALGTLYKKKTPGRYDSETRSFLPPKYDLAFTSEVSEDQDLRLYLSEKRNISIESADYYISEFVENIQAQLADHQQADFSPLGTLKLINDKVVLESSPSIGIGFASYGLPSVSDNQNELPSSDEKIVEEEPVELQNLEPDDQPVYDETAEVNAVQEQNENEERVDIEQEETPENNEISEEASGILDPEWKPAPINRYEYEEEDDHHKSRWVRILIKVGITMLFVFLALGTLIYFLSPNLYYTIKENFTASRMQSEPEEMVDNNPIPKMDSPKVDSAEKKVVITPIAKDTIATAKSVNTIITYEVIGSAMKTQKKVDEVISNLAKRGITAKKMESMPGRLIKISLGTFTDYNVAKKYQDSLKIKLKNPELYIQTIKPKN